MDTTKRICSLLLLALAPLAAAAADISGTWSANFDTAIGPQAYTYQFIVKGSDLTGTAKNADGSRPIQNGKVDNDTVSFVETLTGQGDGITVTYTGKIVAADQIDFTRNVGSFATETFVAKRVTAPPKN
jgi:hypothetical protein